MLPPDSDLANAPTCPDSLADDLGDSLASVLRGIAQTPSTQVPAKTDEGTVIHECFRIERELGRGGMGVVYLARDLRLERDVAIKLHSHLGAEVGDRRLFREAMALARLSHPNVVNVYEVGIYEGRVFVVMEFIDGGTLRTWLEAEPRSIEAVLARFSEAAEGLAATHDAGLVHRDLKPENILVGKDGRARVTDFGLTRWAGNDEERSTENAPTNTDMALTRTGAVMGTPVYMAPEQFDGAEVTAAADQFAFCVSLYEALYGERPFDGSTLAELKKAVTEHEVRPPPPRSNVPRWLRKVLLRGLAPDPARRFPSIRALKRAIDDRRRRDRRLAVGAVVVTLVGAASATTFALAPRDVAPSCTPSDDVLRDIWDAGRKDEVKRAFLATKAVFAEDAWKSVERTLDGYAASLSTTMREACEATHLRGVQSTTALDRQSACLGDRYVALGAYTRVLGRADAKVVERAVNGALGLPAIATCKDAAALTEERRDPADPALAARVATLRRSIADGRALGLAGKYEEARAALERALTEAKSLDFPPIVTEAQVPLGKVLYEKGDLGPAESALTDAFFLAREAGQEELSTSAALTLALDVGAAAARPDEGALWARHALAASRRRRVRGEPAEAQAERVLGILAWSKGHNDEAMAHIERGLAALGQVDGDTRLLEIQMLETLGVVEAARGQLDDAVKHQSRSLALAEEVHGPAHPLIATSLGNLALAHSDAGRYAEALPLLERALAVTEAAFGADHAHTAVHLENLAVAEIGFRRFERALEYLERACKILERERGATHPDVARCRSNRAEALGGAGRHEEALVDAERALVITEKAQRKDQAEVARLTGNLGEALLAVGRDADGIAALEKSLSVWEQTAPNHPFALAPLGALGEALRKQGKRSEARDVLERAAKRIDVGDVDPSLTARAEFSLAQLLWEDTKSQQRALTLARKAKRSYEGLGEGARQQADEVQRWIAAKEQATR